MDQMISLGKDAFAPTSMNILHNIFSIIPERSEDNPFLLGIQSGKNRNITDLHLKVVVGATCGSSVLACTPLHLHIRLLCGSHVKVFL